VDLYAVQENEKFIWMDLVLFRRINAGLLISILIRALAGGLYDEVGREYADVNEQGDTPLENVQSGLD